MSATPRGAETADSVIPPQLLAAAEAGQLFLAAGGTTLDWARIDASLAAAGLPVDVLRNVLQGVNGALTHRFLAGEGATELVADQTALVDRVIRTAWDRSCGPQLPDAVLAAAGGYGRGELHPYSDVDLLVLLPSKRKGDVSEPVSAFLALLWDIGLQVGHSTRTVEECRDESRRDLTTATTLMEARWLLGPEDLFRQMVEACAPPGVWPARSFFEAKLKEQQARHGRYDDTAYNLEPNIKGSPGGLRDIHMILWVAHRHFGKGREISKFEPPPRPLLQRNGHIFFMSRPPLLARRGDPLMLLMVGIQEPARHPSGLKTPGSDRVANRRCGQAYSRLSANDEGHKGTEKKVAACVIRFS